MKNNDDNNTTPAPQKSRFGCLQVFGVVVLFFALAAIFSAWWVKYNIYASEFTPTVLSEQEQKVLDSKLAKLEESAEKEVTVPGRRKVAPRPLKPEAYTEEGARREINLSEKELNGLVTNSTDVAERVAIDLSDDLVSVKLVLPVDEDVIFFGGKTLRIKLGVILGYENEQPVVALKGMSLGGIPLPNAWLGYMKNKNLVEEFGSEHGFWQLFSAGVKNISVRDGQIRIELKE